MVTAFKEMQEAVKLRNLRIKNKQNNTVMGDPPSLYPFIPQQIEEKKKLRKMID
tara:strand:- start:1675 stop:1836 length:162 start_codon:yes stop_codon:yes gene_type:complete